MSCVLNSSHLTKIVVNRNQEKAFRSEKDYNVTSLKCNLSRSIVLIYKKLHAPVTSDEFLKKTFLLLSVAAFS